jgi:viroplasmin and RNaseH domain-containing protein
MMQQYKMKNPKIHEQLAEQADMQIQLDEANKKIADLETSRNNLEKELAEMTIQSNNERRRVDLYRDWYREILQKYTAERERTWWSRLCN